METLRQALLCSEGVVCSVYFGQAFLRQFEVDSATLIETQYARSFKCRAVGSTDTKAQHIVEVYPIDHSFISVHGSFCMDERAVQLERLKAKTTAMHVLGICCPLPVALFSSLVPGDAHPNVEVATGCFVNPAVTNLLFVKQAHADTCTLLDAISDGYYRTDLM